MKRIIVVIAFIAVAGAAAALEFRNTTWLMTRDQVIASESGRVVSVVDRQGQQQVVVRSVVNGFSATITYTLEDDKLLSASYSFRNDTDRAAYAAMRLDLVGRNGAPAFENPELMGWTLERTEIALAHLPDGTTYAAYWEKSYFARINNLKQNGSAARN